jgi:hypothetical protein
VSKYLLGKGYNGLSIWPFIILKDRSLQRDPILMNHEKIHLVQQIEMLILFFYLWYVIEFLLRLVRYRNWTKAYRNISFEKEAYSNEHNLKYRKNRKFWNFLDYI